MKTALLLAAVIGIFIYLRKKPAAASSPDNRPMVPTVDYGAMGAYDFGNG